MESINQQNYRKFPAVSNSDLTWIKDMDDEEKIWLEKAFAFGTLIDNMITEPEKVNYFKKTVEGQTYPYTDEDFFRAKMMKRAFYKDPFCAGFAKQCEFQKISYVPEFKIEYEGQEFILPAKCKWDLFRKDIDLNGDVKSTTATTQKQAEAAVRHFDYDRSRAWYMDLEGSNNDILIFISKVNFKIFKVPIKRGDQWYREGKRKYQELAYKWWSLFGGVNVEQAQREVKKIEF